MARGVFFGPPPDSDLVDQNQQDYVAQIQRALQLQQRTPGRLHRNLSVNFQLDDFTQLEFQWLRGRHTFESHIKEVAVAGQQSWLNIIPAPSKLTVIERLVITNLNPVAQTFVIGIVTPEAGGPGVNFTMCDDRQYFGGASAGAQLLHSTGAAPTEAVGGLLLTVGANAMLDYPVNVVMTGRQNAWNVASWKIVCQQANVRTDVGVRWSERNLLPSESENV